jgi:hypothetical protein
MQDTAPSASPSLARLLATGAAPQTLRRSRPCRQVLRTVPEPSSTNPKLLRKMPALAATRVEGAVTSISLADASSRGFTFFVGTSACNIYKVTYEPATGRLKEELVQTAHSERINGLAFPHEYSDVFATCGTGYIRLWHLSTCRELVRIAVPNLECFCIAFTTDGSAVLSGWSDGKIRAFGPQSGKLLFTINDAHQKAVTAIASTSDSSRILSGGEEGMVRVWRLGRTSQVGLRARAAAEPGALGKRMRGLRAAEARERGVHHSLVSVPRKPTRDRFAAGPPPRRWRRA